jgi:hypothetical protein
MKVFPTLNQHGLGEVRQTFGEGFVSDMARSFLVKLPDRNLNSTPPGIDPVWTLFPDTSRDRTAPLENLKMQSLKHLFFYFFLNFLSLEISHGDALGCGRPLSKVIFSTGLKHFCTF